MKNLIYFLILFLLVFASCKKEEIQPEDSSTPEPPPGSTVIAENSVAFESSTVELISSYNKNTGDLKFSGTNDQINRISSGYILYCPPCPHAEYGLLRKVTYISEDKKSLKTGQAFLEEVLLKGNLHFEGRLTPSGKTKPLLTKEEDLEYDFKIPFEDVVIIDLDQNFSTTNDQIVANGFVNFILELVIDADFDWGLEYFIFKFKVNENSNLKISATFEGSDDYGEVSILKIPLPRIHVGSIFGVPIWVYPILEVVVGTDGKVGISLVEINQDASLTAGVEYTGDWQFIKDFSNNFSHVPPCLEEDINLKGFVGPRLSLILCDLVGPFGQSDAFLRLEAYNRDIGWDLYGGLGARIGANMGVLSKVVPSVQTFTLFETEKLLAQGNISFNNSPVPVFSISPPSGNPSTVFTFDASASFDQEDPLSALQVRWDFDGNGIWDTDFSYSKTATHQYSQNGTYYPKLEVKDSQGASDVAEKVLEVALPENFDIVFQRYFWGNSENYLFGINSDGSNLTQLTFKVGNCDQDEDPCWNFSGDKIYYAHCNFIYSMNPDGSNKNQISIPSGLFRDNPSISPDGTKIIFSATIFSNPYPDIWICNSDGSNEVNLTNTDDFWEDSPVWSPDGTKIAFSKCLEEGEYIFLMNSDGSNQHQLTSRKGSCPCWSSDGTKIFFTSWEGNLEIFSIDLNNFEEVNITNSPNIAEDHASVSPDRTKIVYSQGSFGKEGIWVLDLNTMQRTQLTSNSDGDKNPVWNPTR